MVSGAHLFFLDYYGGAYGRDQCDKGRFTAHILGLHIETHDGVVPLFRACLMARDTASTLAFSISDVKAVISPPPIDWSAPQITPPIPRVLGDNPFIIPITLVIL